MIRIATSLLLLSATPVLAADLPAAVMDDLRREYSTRELAAPPVADRDNRFERRSRMRNVSTPAPTPTPTPTPTPGTPDTPAPQGSPPGDTPTPQSNPPGGTPGQFSNPPSPPPGTPGQHGNPPTPPDKPDKPHKGHHKGDKHHGKGKDR